MSNPLRVPFLDLKAHHQPLRPELDAAIASVVDSCAFAGGPFVAKFEQEFATFCGARFAVGVGNGTDALWLSLLALGVGPGDEVITVPHTFMATAEAISYCGARPVFVDVEEATQTMNPALIERSISPRTKAIIPVHLFGQMANMEAIMEVASRRGIPVVEDACQAHGAQQSGRGAGTIGATGCFSFYPGKNLGAFGEAGAVITNDPELKRKMDVFRDHGQSKKYYHSEIGWNARMDGIQAAVLSVKLRHLQAGNDRRRSHAALYNELLADLPLITPTEAAVNRHVYHIYPVRVTERDRVLQAMTAVGIGCGIHYPVPVHLQQAYNSLGQGPGSFPVSEQCASELLSLPMYPELTADQVRLVADELKACLVAGKTDACTV